MNAAEHDRQAAAFLDFHRRHGGTLEGDFRVWSQSKSMPAEVIRAISAIVHETALSTGERTVTDLNDWSGIMPVDGLPATDYLLP